MEMESYQMRPAGTALLAGLMATCVSISSLFVIT